MHTNWEHCSPTRQPSHAEQPTADTFNTPPPHLLLALLVRPLLALLALLALAAARLLLKQAAAKMELPSELLVQPSIPFIV